MIRINGKINSNPNKANILGVAFEVRLVLNHRADLIFNDIKDGERLLGNKFKGDFVNPTFGGLRGRKITILIYD